MPRHVPIKESLNKHLLDLDSVLTVADRINSVVPGLRTSATFFTFLRSNLVLPPSTLNSTTSTPLLDASSSQTLPPLLTTSSLATMSYLEADVSDLPPPAQPSTTPNTATNPLDGIPPLTTTLLTTEDSKIAALKLVADSIAQQRQYAARAIIFHPLTLALYVLLLATISQFLYKTRSDLGIVFTTGAGVTMACLVAVRGATGGYLALAEEIGWGFVRSEDGSGEEDLMVGSYFGEELIGALVLRLERNGGGGSPNGKRKGKGGGKSGGNGVVRAWTVRNKYRGKGVGTELLEEAVRITKEKLGNSAGVGFAAEHANSKMILPGIFNGGFKRREGMAGRMLAGVVENANGSKKKR
ncbi:hypothetical protein ONS95_009935 [Cadophora gregata]|uniref:uncharacterized protein n=1 Tax=Cadophora gregata TaxID=51156 RepID=UPI0026DBD6A5|nr:uncharacterized protein ONS95_009935 [Cadophora gregata]KAK0121647.1 hypothetical protein ONS95_009935 [Cadophora gregata]KAK0127122.1 hypothetical protein ONS96_006680 [Cadophora gregata f. sp. sojae]